MEVVPHYRRPHMALVWTGAGRAVPKVVPRRGSVVHRDRPTNELIDVLSKRRMVFFPDDNRLIEGYRVGSTSEGFVIYVTFVEPS